MARRRSHRGIALIIVLLLTAILMLVVLEFAHSMQVYAMIGGNARYDVQLRAGLQAGVAFAQRVLLDDALLDIENDVDMDHLDEAWAGEFDSIRLEGVAIDVALEDEAGKFPLNSLVKYTVEDGTLTASEVDDTRRQQLALLFEELKIERDLIDVLVDWLDVDEDAQPRGAESAAYAGAGRQCRNGPLTSIEELELLQGFTQEIVWGDPDDDRSVGLAQVCTIYGREDGRVNANTAPEVVLTALLDADDLARRVTSERERDPFVDQADLNERVGDSSVSEALGTASGSWSAVVTAHTTHAVRPLTMRARAVLHRTREGSEPPEQAAPTGDAGSPAPDPFAGSGAAGDTGDTGEEPNRVAIRVVAWKETR